MKTSDSIGAIAAALAAVQGELKNPHKDKVAKINSNKGSFSYSYADFAATLDMIRPVLAKHKMALVQSPFVRDNFVFLESRLVHESGEWLASEYPVGLIADHRTMGSALSYARRYSAMPLLAIQGEEDDDGEADAERPRFEPRPVIAPPADPVEAYIRKFNEAVSAGEFEEQVSKARAAWTRFDAEGKKRIAASIEARRAFWSQAPSEAAE